jgi:uncharacterized protein YndB with AHSA1/START domain
MTQHTRTQPHRMSALLDGSTTVFTRLFDAPRELVWKAWTEPTMLCQWWGPKDFTCPEAVMDLRVGGEYKLVMRGSDGTEFPVKGVILEVVPSEKLVMTDVADDMPKAWLEQAKAFGSGDGGRLPQSFWSVTFEARGQQTLVRITTQFASEADRDAMIRMGMEEGWAESLDKLDAALANVTATH